MLAVALALSAGPALAAPTCWDREGHAVRCGTPGAGPVGAALAPDQAAARLAIPTYPSFCQRPRRPLRLLPTLTAVFS